MMRGIIKVKRDSHSVALSLPFLAHPKMQGNFAAPLGITTVLMSSRNNSMSLFDMNPPPSPPPVRKSPSSQPPLSSSLASQLPVLPDSLQFVSFLLLFCLSVRPSPFALFLS
ncbi:hypothetical protein O181_093917 [Austropuccinia psidii MF-1]|uniref:Uncharacterized protein n=1 Tax=Austropuccinia psidii MF-1 TaxID=1389203 RepID=A0A9Q3J1Y2_9BASI|nr:hypothetical protein [Austropuccinia psidii MF-1]